MMGTTTPQAYESAEAFLNVVVEALQKLGDVL